MCEFGRGRTDILSLKWTVHNVVGNKNIPTEEVVQRYYMEEVSCGQCEPAKDWPRAYFPG